MHVCIATGTGTSEKGLLVILKQSDKTKKLIIVRIVGATRTSKTSTLQSVH